MISNKSKLLLTFDEFSNVLKMSYAFNSRLIFCTSSQLIFKNICANNKDDTLIQR